MDELIVDPDQVDGAADALRRNSEYLTDMTDYAEQLRETAGGAFGSIFGTWKANHDDATGRQATLLRTMREKLAATSEALHASATVYREVEARLTQLNDTLTAELGTIEVPLGIGSPMPTPVGGR